MAWFDLLTGYLASMALGALAVRRRGLGGLVKQIPLMPLYWLLTWKSRRPVLQQRCRL